MRPFERLLEPEEVETHLVNLYELFQRELERAGALPHPRRTLPQLLWPLFRIAGAVQLGLLTASLTTLVMFIVINLFFHLRL